MARTAYKKDTKTARKRITKKIVQSKPSIDSNNEKKSFKPSLAKGTRKKSLAIKTPRIITPSIHVKKRLTKNNNIIREIAYFQKNTDTLIRKLPFSRYIRDIVRNVSSRSRDFRFERKSVLALQEAFEAYIVSLLEDSNLCAAHAKRVTLFDRDIELVKKLSKDTYD